MRRFFTRDLLTCAAIGAAGGILTVPLLVFFTAGAVAGIPFLYAALVGVWFIPAALAQRLLNIPGAALLTMFTAAVVSVPFSPYGPWVLLSTTFSGLVLEVPWLFTWFKRLIPWTVYAWTLVWGIAYGWWIFYGVDLSAPEGSLPALVAIVTVSHLVSVWLGRFLAVRLAATGVGRRVVKQDTAPGAP